MIFLISNRENKIIHQNFGSKMADKTSGTIEKQFVGQEEEWSFIKIVPRDLPSQQSVTVPINYNLRAVPKKRGVWD